MQNRKLYESVGKYIDSITLINMKKMQILR